MSNEHLIARRAKLQQMIDNIDDVLLQLSTNSRASYTINSGQTVETVTVANTQGLLTSQQRIQARIDEIDDQLNGTGDPTYMRPAF